MAFKKWVANQHNEFKPQNETFIVLGTFILWVSWLFFNGSSTLDMFAKRAGSPAKIIMNTMMGGAAGGIVTVFLRHRLLGTYSYVSRFDV